MAVAPNLTFEPHTAPLDIKFSYGPTSSMGIYDDGSAWVTLHGSWDSDPPVGYKLVQVALTNATGPGGGITLQTQATSSSQTGYKDIFWNRDLSVCPQDCFSQDGLAYDSTGRLCMCIDSTG